MTLLDHGAHGGRDVQRKWPFWVQAGVPQPGEEQSFWGIISLRERSPSYSKDQRGEEELQLCGCSLALSLISYVTLGK